MNCRFRHDDAAYVLGALDPTERAEFEAHLGDCPDCEAAVNGLGSLPGMLAHAPIEDLYTPSQPVPDSLLPNVVEKVGRRRRRHRLRTAFVAAAATVAIAAATVIGIEVWNSEEAVSQAAELGPVVSSQVWAEAAMTSHAEGTEIRLICHHPSSGGTSGKPGEYQLVVTNAKGDTAVAGSWVGDTDGDSRVVLFTRWQPEKIDGLEVQDLEGKPVMRWQR